MKKVFIVFMLVLIFITCQQRQEYAKKGMSMGDLKVEQVVQQLTQQHGDEYAEQIEKGVKQTARFWRATVALCNHTLPRSGSTIWRTAAAFFIGVKRVECEYVILDRLLRGMR